MSALEQLAERVKHRLYAETPRGIIAKQRCLDVHPERWDVPTVLAEIMDPCEACKSWGDHVAAMLPAPPLMARDSRLRAGVRKVARECLTRRDYWSNSRIDGAVARAVAYQSIAGLLIRELDEDTPRR
jgi:hypothetical protein